MFSGIKLFRISLIPKVNIRIELSSWPKNLAYDAFTAPCGEYSISKLGC